MKFSDVENTVVFRAKKLMEIWYLLITEKFLFWIFQRWEIRSFVEAKSWQKDGIYWLQKSSCFELFDDGKYFFSAKMLIETLYLLGLFELSIIFQDLGKMVFLAVLMCSYRKKKCRLKHLGNKLHLPPVHDTSKIKDYEQRNSPAFQEVLLFTISCISYSK